MLPVSFFKMYSNQKRLKLEVLRFFCLKRYSLGSSTGSRRKVRVYRRNLDKLFIWVLVKKKKLDGHCHDLHMCPNSDIFKVADLYLGQLGE